MTRVPLHTTALRLLTAVLACATILGLAELLAWCLPPLHPMDNPWFENVSPNRDTANPDLPFRRPPHLTWQGSSRGDLAIFNQDRDPYARPLTFKTDHEGFRNDRDLQQAELIFIGDSFTEAGNVAESETFVQLIAGALGKPARNLGISGYTPPIERIVLERFGLTNQPSVVIWQVAEANDLHDAVKYRDWLAHGRPLPTQADMPGRLTRKESWRLRSPSCRLLTLFRPPRPWTRGVSGRFTTSDGSSHPLRFLYLPDANAQPAAHPGYPDVVAALVEGHRLLTERGIALVVCLMPTKFRVFAHVTQFDPESERILQSRGLQPPDWTPPPHATLAPHLAAACASNAIPFIDLTPALHAQAAAGTLVYLPFDTHLSPNGHQVVAAALLSYLRELPNTRP